MDDEQYRVKRLPWRKRGDTLIWTAEVGQFYFMVRFDSKVDSWIWSTRVDRGMCKSLEHGQEICQQMLESDQYIGGCLEIMPPKVVTRQAVSPVIPTAGYLQMARMVRARKQQCHDLRK